MTTHEPRTTPDRGAADSETLRERRVRRRRAQRRRRIAVGTGVGVALISGVGILGSVGDGIPAKVTIGGVEVGGMSDAEARAALEEVSRSALAERRIALRAPQGSGYSDEIAAGTLASAARVDEAIAAAISSRGRVQRVLAKIGLAGTEVIPLTYTLRPGQVERVVAAVQKTLGAKPVSASVAVEGEEIVTTAAVPGREVDRALLERLLATLPTTLDVPVREARPPGDDDDAAAAKSLAERILATERTVTLGPKSATLTRAATLKALRFPLGKQTIAVRLDPDVLRSVLVRPLGANERPARDARLEIRGNRVVVVPSRPARQLNGAALSTAIVTAPDAPSVTAKVALSPAEFTTVEAKALKITEKISEFTTPYDCCPPRVTNIRRAAEILNGTILGAGKRFSLNDALGERRADRGFVKAPSIAAGELVDTFGGGVSQVATTMYNAAFFGGLALEAHTPHEFYISRYPMGREATVSWRTPDLVFKNDWDAAILMSVQAGNNGITVAFYSSKLGRRVETTTGSPSNYTQPKTVERKNPDLEPGTRKIIQTAGPRGFAISYTRKVYRGDKLLRDEVFRWTYRPENEIVELGPPLPEEPDEPDPPDGETPSTPTTPPTNTTPATTTPSTPTP